jgi:ferredoxin
VRITVDKRRCIGAGLCALKLPAVFEQDADEGLVELLDETGAGHTYDEVLTSQYECPAQAIGVATAET